MKSISEQEVEERAERGREVKPTENETGEKCCGLIKNRRSILDLRTPDLKIAMNKS